MHIYQRFLTAFIIVLGLILAFENAFAVDVISVAPTQNTVNVPTGAVISATFNLDLDPAAIDDNSCRITSRLIGPVSKTITYDQPSRTITVTPDQPLKVGDIITVQLTEAIQETGGENLAGGFAWSFTVEATAGYGALRKYVDYEVDSYPNYVTAADIDGDGDIDLLSANPGESWAPASSVSILYNNGEGTFLPQQIVPMPGGPACVVAADLDNDGDLDLAAGAKYINYVAISINEDGAFGEGVRNYCGDRPFAVCPIDYDGDGDLDLATADWNSKTVSILDNAGDATFTRHAAYNTSGCPTDIGTADFNHDGYADLACITFCGYDLIIFMNNGDGTFADATYYECHQAPRDLYIADYDGDGDADLAINNSIAYDITIFNNDGNGIFSMSETYPSHAFPAGISACDLDADGILDLVHGYGMDFSLEFYRGFGDGTFSNHLRYPTLSDDYYSTVGADFNGDGAIDIAAADLDNWVISVFLNGYICGDANFDTMVDVADAVYLVNMVFREGPAPYPNDSGDTNLDGEVSVGDVVYLINYIFKGGPEPVSPW